MRDFVNSHAGLALETQAIPNERHRPLFEANQHLNLLPPEQQAIRDRCFHSPGSYVEFRAEDINTSVSERFEKIVRRYPENVAVEMGGKSVTYRELDAMANRTAQAILTRAGDDSSPIALLFDKGIEQFGAMLGVLRAGRFFVSLEPSLPKSRLDLTAADYRPQLIITDQSHRVLAQDLVADSHRVLTIDSVLDDDYITATDPRISPDAYACIMFTSGSTGRPKGIIWSQLSLLHHVMLRTNADGLCAADRIAHLTAGTSNATTNVFFALLNGATLLAYDTDRRSMSDIWDWLAREHVTVCMIAAPLFRSLCAVPGKRSRLVDLRLIRLRSDTALVSDVNLFKENFPGQCVLANGLASSETGMLSEFYIGHDTVLDGDSVPVGYAAPDKELRVVDDDGHPLDHDLVGELVVRSRFLSPGYWRDPKLTNEKFKTDPDDPTMRLYYTGDLALLRRDGCLIHKGRKDFRVKIRGYGVDIVEVEKILHAHTDVSQAVVVARPDKAGEMRLVAYLTSRSQAGPSVSELRAVMRGKLSDYMIPSAFKRLDKLPLTSNGKIDRAALPEPDEMRPQLNVAYVEPRDELEQELCRIWVKILALDVVGIHDNFFDLGGQSLAAIRMISEVEQRLGKKFSVATLLQAPTVAQLASALTAQIDATPSALIAVQSNGSKPPFFCVHGTDSYARLARHLGIDQPFFGLAQHLDGRKVRHTRIENIAAYYIEAMKTFQAQGPYYIGGHSIGGLIAFEMAQQLQRQGQEIRLLVIIDSGEPLKRRPGGKPMAPDIESIHHSLKQPMEWFKKQDFIAPTSAKEKLLKRAKTATCALYHRIGVSLPPLLQAFYIDQVVYGEIYPKAHWDYVPRNYSGRAVYLKSEDSRERVAGWEMLMTQGLEVRSVTGNHLSMLDEPNLTALAEALKDCLTDAQQNPKRVVTSRF